MPRNVLEGTQLLPPRLTGACVENGGEERSWENKVKPVQGKENEEQESLRRRFTLWCCDIGG